MASISTPWTWTSKPQVCRRTASRALSDAPSRLPTYLPLSNPPCHHNPRIRVYNVVHLNTLSSTAHFILNNLKSILSASVRVLVGLSPALYRCPTPSSVCEFALVYTRGFVQIALFTYLSSGSVNHPCHSLCRNSWQSHVFKFHPPEVLLI